MLPRVCQFRGANAPLGGGNVQISRRRWRRNDATLVYLLVCRRRIFGCCGVLLDAGIGPHKRRQVMAPGEIRAARIPQSYNIVSRKRSCEMRADKLLYYFYGVVRRAQMAATPPPAPESAARRKWRYIEAILPPLLLYRTRGRMSHPGRRFYQFLAPFSSVCAHLYTHTPCRRDKQNICLVSEERKLAALYELYFYYCCVYSGIILSYLHSQRHVTCYAIIIVCKPILLIVQ
jgi:hypothetical protein